MAEVWEVASFYDHFDLVKEGETPTSQTNHPHLHIFVMHDGRW